MKKTQLIINIITVIASIIILILVYKMLINSKYSQRYIKELVDKNTDTTNYIIEKEKIFIRSETKNLEKIIQKSDGRKEEYSSTGKIMIYANNLEINESRKTYTEVKVQEIDKDGKVNEKTYTTKEMVKLHPLKNEFNSYIYIDSSKYEYLGKEKIDNTKCIKGKFTLYEKSNYIIVWIDLKTGFIIKEEEYKEGKLDNIVTYNTKINIVTDQDIIIPKLEDYNYYE